MSGEAVMRHGRLSVQLPPGWTDDSTLVFRAPPAAGLAAPLSGKQGPNHQTNVVVSFLERSEEVTARGFLEQVAAALPQARPIESGPMRLGEREGWYVVRQLQAESTLVRQLSVALAAGPVLVLATASFSASAVGAEMANVRTILSSIRLT